MIKNEVCKWKIQQEYDSHKAYDSIKRPYMFINNCWS